jgi:hypothetical protein
LFTADSYSAPVAKLENVVAGAGVVAVAGVVAGGADTGFVAGGADTGFVARGADTGLVAGGAVAGVLALGLLTIQTIKSFSVIPHSDTWTASASIFPGSDSVTLANQFLQINIMSLLLLNFGFKIQDLRYLYGQ